MKDLYPLDIPIEVFMNPITSKLIVNPEDIDILIDCYRKDFNEDGTKKKKYKNRKKYISNEEINDLNWKIYNDLPL